MELVAYRATGITLHSCWADADCGRHPGRKRMEACARRCFPPPVVQPYAALRSMRLRHAGVGHDAVHDHVCLHGLPQPGQQVLGCISTEILFCDKSNIGVLGDGQPYGTLLLRCRHPFVFMMDTRQEQ